jgi:hypothetical protein
VRGPEAPPAPVFYDGGRKGDAMHRTVIARTSALALAALVALLVPAAALADSWSNVALVDVNCSQRVKDDPDAHPRACALKCADSGYGIWTAEGEYLKFDAAGSKKAKALLEASDRADTLRVDVTGELADGVLTVATIRFTE